MMISLSSALNTPSATNFLFFDTWAAMMASLVEVNQAVLEHPISHKLPLLRHLGRHDGL